MSSEGDYVYEDEVTAQADSVKDTGAEPSSKSFCQLRLVLLWAAFVFLVTAVCLGGLVLVWKGWVTGNSNGTYFKSGLLAYTIKVGNADEVREPWRECCKASPFVAKTTATDTNTFEHAGEVAFGLIFVAICVCAVAIVIAAIVSMPRAFACPCASATYQCEFITLAVLDALALLLGFIGFGTYAAFTNDVKDRLLCIPPACVNQTVDTSFGGAFIVGGIAAAFIAASFLIHLGYALGNWLACCGLCTADKGDDAGAGAASDAETAPASDASAGDDNETDDEADGDEDEDEDEDEGDDADADAEYS